VRVALVVFRPQRTEERPVAIVGLLALWLFPLFVSVGRFVAARAWPLLLQKVQMELPVAGIVMLFILVEVAGVGVILWVQNNLDTFVCFPATLVFLVYAMVPGTSIWMATLSVLHGAVEAPFFVLLGLFNLCSGVLRWANDMCDDAELEKASEPAIGAYRPWVTKARRVMWVVLIVDFIVEEVLGRVFGAHSWRLLGPPLTNSEKTLSEYRTLSFIAGLASAWAQAQVLDLLKRRTVLLRLLGARNTILNGARLLLMGAFAVVQQARTVAFLREVSPTPRWCCVILWCRRFGAIAGVVLPVLFHFLLQPLFLGSLHSDTLVPISVAGGAVLGHFASSSFSSLWQEKKEHLEADYRVLHLFPHISAQARSKASAAMRVAYERGKQATTNTAVEWVTTRVFRSGIGYLSRSFFSQAA